MKADLHIHSKYSGIGKIWKLKFLDSVEEPRNILKAAEKKGLSVIAITDHNTIKGGLKAKKYEKEFNVEVIVGSEILTKEGEIIGLFLNEEIPKGLSAEETVELIKEQGGLAIASHPYSPICKSLGDKIFDLNLDGVEVFNAYHRDGLVNNLALKKVIENYHKNPVAFIGSSDAHISSMVGNGYTLFNGETAEDLYKAIKSKKTTFGGSPTPLKQIIMWSYKTVCYSERKLIKSLYKNNVNLLNYCLDSLKFYKKLIIILAGAIYLFSPLPVISGIVGNYYLKYMAKKKFKALELS